MIERLLQDMRYAARTLRKSPGFTSVAVLTLALGIGATTLVFSVIDSVLLRPFPWENPERLMALRSQHPRLGVSDSEVSYPDFHDWRERSQSYAAMAAYTDRAFNLARPDAPVNAPGAEVSASLFALLGVQPLHGRAFLAEEDRPDAERVAVVSHRLWQDSFGGDPATVGRTILIDGTPHTVVGVMPAGFSFPEVAQLWKPLALDPTAHRGSRFLDVIGRLGPGVTREQAAGELNAIAQRLSEEHPEANAGWGASVVPLREHWVGEARTSLYVMLGAVGFVLLIACANLANLLLARALTRQREIGVRSALGAGRWRVARQVLTESVVLALLGGAVGVLAAHWGLALVRAALPPFFPAWIAMVVDNRALGFTLLLALGTGVLFGLVPALHAASVDPQAMLREGGRGGTAGVRRTRLRQGLVVAEIALALVLLIGATLLIRSTLAMQRVDAGFDPNGVLTLRLNLSGPAYDHADRRIAFFGQVTERIGALPGVIEVGAVNSVPLSGSTTTSTVFVEGRSYGSHEQPEAEYKPVAGEYLAAMRIPLRAGRLFTAAETLDSAALTAVVSEGMARRLWPGEEAVGKRFRLGMAHESPWRTVVGVVGDVRHRRISAQPANQLYLPYATGATRFMTVVVHTAADPAAAVPMVRAALRAVDPHLPAYDVLTMQEVARRSLWQQRLIGGLFGSFAAITLLLASLGVYGVMAFSVAHRTHEIGVRMALGASTPEVLRLVVRGGLLLAGLGIAIGMAGALAVTRVLESLVFGVGVTDLPTFVGVAVLLAAVALLASYLPARRATRVDPMVALRVE